MNFTLTMTRSGLITLPADLQKQLCPDDSLQIIAEITSDGILLKPLSTDLIEIYSSGRLTEFASTERVLSLSMM
jgi:bifunctional DNA-binding transcriptional regulator/antitoxin component of YhaV-PrlF toxin-antitoxin module